MKSNVFCNNTLTSSRFSLYIVVFITLMTLDIPYAQAENRQAVVKIFVTQNPMDFYRPWQSQGSQAATGSGFVISGNRIVTNAHVVIDNTFIQVRKESDPKKYTARLLAIGNDCDLAIVTVDDPEFFKGISPLEFGELPQLQDKVTVVGFPAGGDKLSVTEGVVSRIEVIPYTQSGKKLLAIQIDAAINPGNSGGPVFKDDLVIGVAMQIITNSQNIGYMIPPPIVDHFLQDLEDGNYDGFPTLGIEYYNTENETLRNFYQIPDQKGGVIIAWPMPFSSSEQFLNPNDILLKIDGVSIGVDGTFDFRESERLDLSYLITKKQIGEKIEVVISRQGKLQNLTIPIKQYVGLIPYPNYYQKPSYYIYGGLVFTVLSADLLQSWGQKWWKDAPNNFLYCLFGSGRLNKDRKEDIVVLLSVLPDDINVGYHSFGNEIITKVNGEAFNSFQEFTQLVEKGNNKTTIFETEVNAQIIIDNSQVDSITQDILKRNNIPARFSSDVAGWLGKEGPA